MITSTLLVALLPHLGQDASELARVRAFDVAARIGLESGTALPPYPEADKEPEYAAFLTDKDYQRRKIRVYQYNQADFYLDYANGRIVSYSDISRLGAFRNPDGSLAPRKVSDDQAAALAQRFYTTAGWPGDLQPLDFRDGQGGNDRSVLVRYGVKAGVVLYDEDRWQGLIYVNRETGQLDGFGSPVAVFALGLPASPASLAPRLSVDAARLAALRFGVDLRGESLVESSAMPLQLRVWLPRLPLTTKYGERTASRPRLAAAIDARRGMLVYTGWLLGGSRQTAVRVTIDAETGEALGTEDALPNGSAGGGGGGSPAGDLRVPTATRPWRVATGGEGWKAWSAPVTAALVPVAGAAPKGGKVVISDGRLALAATYDAKTNLLGADGRAYRPGPPLAALLRRRTKEAGRSGTPPHASKL